MKDAAPSNAERFANPAALMWSEIRGDARNNPVRYARSKDTGEWIRVRYRAVAPACYIGGKGYHHVKRVQMWPASWGETAEEAAEHAGPGNRFCWMGTASEFARLTYPPEDLPPMGREAAREALTARPGAEEAPVLVCQFVKRTNGQLRVMRLRYDPEKASPDSVPFDTEAKGLLPVWDLDKRAARFINLDDVRTIGASVDGKSPMLA